MLYPLRNHNDNVENYNEPKQNKNIKKKFSKVSHLYPNKIKPLKNTKKIIIPYSQIKIKEKSPPPYSTLKPDTNSDSPSEKSKGVRFLSAKQI